MNATMGIRSDVLRPTALARIAVLAALAWTATACKTLDPKPVQEYADSVSKLRDGADAALAVNAADAHDRTVHFPAVNDQGAFDAGEKLVLEKDKPGQMPLFLEAERFRIAVKRLNDAEVDYANLLVQLASPQTVDAATFDQLAKDVDAKVASALATLNKPVPAQGLALLSTGFAELARAYLESKRIADFVAVLDHAQKSVDDYAAKGRSAVATATDDAWHEYEAHAGKLEGPMARLKKDPAAAAQAREELVDLDVRFVAHLGVLTDLDAAFAAIPAAHRGLVNAVATHGADLATAHMLVDRAAVLKQTYDDALATNRKANAELAAKRADADADAAEQSAKEADAASAGAEKEATDAEAAAAKDPNDDKKKQTATDLRTKADAKKQRAALLDAAAKSARKAADSADAAAKALGAS
jgi:hypothetical protein